jgi:hypothetical protein
VAEQARRCIEYARDHHRHDITDADITATVEHIQAGSTCTHVPPGVSNPLVVFIDHDQTERDAASKAIEAGSENDGVKVLIIDRLETLTRTSRALAGTIDRLNAHGVVVETVHRGYRFPQPAHEEKVTPGTGYVTETQTPTTPHPTPDTATPVGRPWATTSLMGVCDQLITIRSCAPRY